MSAPKQTSILRHLSTRRTYGLLLSLALTAALAYVLQSSGTKASAARVENGNPPVTVSSKSKELTYVPGEVLVRFRAEAKAVNAEKAELSLRDSVGNEIPIRFERPEGLEIVRGLRVAHVGGEETLRAVALLRARPDVVYAEPNYVRRKLAAPNDPRYSEQWNMRGGPPGPTAGAHAEAAWDVTTGSRSVVVGVIDEGIDTNHQDLQANIWRNPGEVANNGIDDDGNGYVDDINGWDFFHNDRSVYDNPANVSGVDAPDAHGTHVAGIVGAVGNNAVGVAGVNWQVSLMSLKILGPDGEGPAPASVLETVRAYAYAKRMRELFLSSGGSVGANVRVLNNSYGGVGRSQSELDAINELASVGILFVVASGNDSENNEQLPSYPGGYDTPNLINVAASDPGDAVASFSNYSPSSVHMSAPGVSVLSTTPGNTYNYSSGTSMASPHVAGAAALICAALPDISVARLRAALLFGGDTIASQTGKTVTGRRLNVANSLQLAQAADASAPSPAAVSIAAQDGRSVTLAWTAPGDDGTAGQASLYEIRFVGPSPGEQFRLAAFRPGTVGAQQSATVKIPYRHTSGTLALKTFDDAGNVGTASVPVTVDDLSANPYTLTTGPPTPLTTGGTPLHVNFDDFYTTYFMPFAFPFFEGFGGGAQQVHVTTNGAIFYGRFPQNDALSYVARLEGWRMIAGLWDDLDLRTCFRPDADIYVTQDTDRVVFRWQGVRFQSAQCPASPAGRAVNFEIELRRDGTIIERYGDGNQRVFPVAGISDGEPSAYVAATHTSEFEPVDLTNAQTVTYALRRPPARADLRISEYPFNYFYPIRINDEFEIPIAVTNAGPDKAAGVRLTTTPPFQNQAVLVSCSVSQGVCSAGDGGTAVVDFGGIASGATARVTLTFKAVTLGNGFDIRHRVTSNTYDPSSSDNDATTIINIFEGNPNPLTGVVSVSGGGSHSLALKPDGTVLAWGQNFAGQLGDGGFTFYAERAQSVPNLTGVASVAAGTKHSLAVKTTGSVWSWGENVSGQLGDGTTTVRKRPTRVPNLAGVVAASASLHSLALKGDGTVWAWGANGQGQLGDGTTNARSTPAQVANLSGVKAVAAGANFSVVLKTDGTVWAWGANDQGQLGDGTNAQRTAPVRVVGLSDVAAIAAGLGHAVALKTDGTVWAWGLGGNGQMGDGTTTSRTSPVQVQGLSGVVSVVCGDYFALALKSDKTVWGWGSNFNGALGDGTNTQRNSPARAVNMKNALAIAAGGQHSFALKAGGTVWTWGDNTYGQLGSGGTSSRPWPYEAMAQRPDPPPIGILSDPTFTPSGGSLGGAQNVGVHVAGDDLKVNAAAIGGSNSLAIASDGKLYAWGNNGYGQAGTEPPAPGPFNSIEALPRAIQLTGVVSASANNANGYALKSDGTVWAWGIGGGLGNGASSADGLAHPTPVQVASLAGVKAIATGAGHAVVLKTDGTVWTWGANNNGQLGDGSTVEFRTSPVQVLNLTGVVSVAAMFNNTYALKGDGTVWAWGYNGGGQAGDGSMFNQRNSPVQVAGLTNVKSIFGGYACGLAVRTDGTLWGWGTINNIIIPNAHPVEGLTNVRMAAAGSDFAAALKEDGTVWTWGSNARGQLGNGQLGGPPYGGRVDTPTKVEALSDVAWLAVSDGYTSDCFVAALKTDGSLWMWGSNVLGQLGDGSLAARFLPTPVDTLAGNILVYYTTDGREPTQDDAFVRAGGSLTIDHSVTLKARAFRDGWTPSGVTSTSFVVSGNSIDATAFFVRQHYLDFLNREPDASGLAFWTQNIDSCNNLQCREVMRVNTSAAFFLSIEFQETGFLVYRMNKSAFGDLPGKPVPVRRAELLADMQLIGQGVVVGQGSWREQLETNKNAFATTFVQRQRFTDAYPASMTAAEFVAKLNANTGNALTAEQANDIAQELAAGGNTIAARASALRKVAENAEVSRREKNRAFVLMQYFGYLRRDPDESPETTLDYAGFNFWLSKLNQFNGDFVKAEMVKAFLDSTEYRKRFGL